LLISTSDHHRLQQHKHVVDAARKAGVRHIVYTGADIKNKQFEIVSKDLESLLGRKPASLKEGLKAIYNL
jgi:NAD(P)H dehydrogenase (quinone)